MQSQFHRNISTSPLKRQWVTTATCNVSFPKKHEGALIKTAPFPLRMRKNSQRVIGLGALTQMCSVLLLPGKRS